MLSELARLALAAVVREYPNQPQHLMQSELDAPSTPRSLHPAFYGSFDWHSAVHGHWMLARVLRREPQLPEAAQIRALLDAHLTPENLDRERDYLARHPWFERPYGWAWLLLLAEELSHHEDARWHQAVVPAARVVAEHLAAYLPRLRYPVRAGTHANTAFGLCFALDYARAAGDHALAHLIEERALDYFMDDRDAPLAYEPSGEDFLSPALEEADLMRRVLPAPAFARWLHGFLPAMTLAPASVSDRTDGRLAHLDGLNLSRAWCLRGIARVLRNDDPRRDRYVAAADAHAEIGLANVATGHYAGEHWLASFAVYLLEAA